MKKITFLKPLLLAVGLLTGASAWAQTTASYEILFGSPVYTDEVITGVTPATEFTEDNSEQDYSTMSLQISGSCLAGNQAGGRNYAFTSAPTTGKVYFKANGKFIGGNYNFFSIKGSVTDSENTVNDNYDIVQSPYALPSGSGGTTVLRIFGQNITVDYVYTPRNVVYGFDITIDLKYQKVDYAVTYASKGSSGTVSALSTVSGSVAVPDGYTLNSVSSWSLPRLGQNLDYYYDNVAFYSEVPTEDIPVYSYTVNAVDGSGNILKQLASGRDDKGAIITYYYNNVLNVNGTLYQAAAVSSSYKSNFTLDADNKVVTKVYSQPATPITNLVFLAEGEDVFTKGTGSSADTRCSMGAGGYAGSKTAFVTLPAGTYYLVLSNRCSGTRTGIHKFYQGDATDAFWAADGNGYNATRESGEFVLSSTTTLYMQGGDNNQYVDWLYIYGTPTNEIVGALDCSTGFMGASKSMTISKGETINVTFNNHGNGAYNWNNWLVRLSGTTGVNHTLRADNFVLGDDNSTVSTRSITEDGGAINWTDFLEDMKDSEVEMTITYDSEGMFSITATSTGSAHTYVHNFAYNDAKSGDITVELGVELAWLEITEIVKSIGVNVTITSAGWATLYSKNALNFSGIDGLTAYTATLSENTVTLTEVSDVPANSGVVLKGTEGDYSIPFIASSETAKGDLVGNATEATAFDAFVGYDLYMLALNTDKEAQFTKVISGSVAAGKAFLKVPATNTARSFKVVFAGETTGISEVYTKDDVRGGTFNLSGQRVAQPTKGLYVVNGKKVIMK